MIRVEHLNKTYGDGDEMVRGANDISFAVEEGSFTSIIGRSGAGKSTLLHMIGGLLPPDNGKVYIEGIDLYSLKEKERTVLRRRRMGFIHQTFDLIPEFSVIENIILPSSIDKRRPDMLFVDRVMKHLEIIDKKYNYPEELSGGEKQRVAIARALSMKPAILLADEPTGNLDLKSEEQLLYFLKICNREFRQTTLMVTHNLEIANVSDRIIKIQDGGIISNTEGSCYE